MTPLSSLISGILTRDLVSLRKEIEAYPADQDLWRDAEGITNPGGTLALHLTGNLQHFIGAVLGNTGYVRNRDAEFAERDVPRAEVLHRIDAAVAAVRETLSRLTDADLAREYPLPIGKTRVETGDFLIHLATHLTYHLGQVDYHRRMVTRSGATVSTVAPWRLHTAREDA
jgi:uncharacterized damage-inducible protein DinB